jgi:hypothetical protein
MATVAFAGSTLWNDASTGKGRPSRVLEAKSIVWGGGVVPGDGAIISKDLADNFGRFFLQMVYWLEDSDIASLISLIEGKRNIIGTVTYPPSNSVSNCRIDGPPVIAPTNQRAQRGSTFYYEYIVSIPFRKVA